jgi:hypothetical protein
MSEQSKPPPQPTGSMQQFDVLNQVAKLLVGRGAPMCAQKWLNLSATGYSCSLVKQKVSVCD